MLRGPGEYANVTHERQGCLVDGFDALVRTLRPIIDPELIRFAFADDRAVAVLGAFPDPSDLLRPRWRWPGDGDLVRLARLFAGRRRIDHYRLMFFGIVPGYRNAGADALLYSEVVAHGERHGYARCDASLLLEVNTPVLRAVEGMGGRRTKTWRIYDLEL